MLSHPPTDPSIRLCPQPPHLEKPATCPKYKQRAAARRTVGAGGLQMRHKIAAAAVLPLLSILNNKHNALGAGGLRGAGVHGCVGGWVSG